VHTYELALLPPEKFDAAASRILSVRRRASRIWPAPAGKLTAARLRGLMGAFGAMTLEAINHTTKIHPTSLHANKK